MNRLWKYALVAAFLAAVIAFLIFLDRREVSEYHKLTCRGIRVEFEAGADKSFITEADVKGYIARGYGECSGRRLEEIDLIRIEEVLNSGGLFCAPTPTLPRTGSSMCPSPSAAPS